MKVCKSTPEHYMEAKTKTKKSVAVGIYREVDLARGMSSWDGMTTDESMKPSAINDGRNLQCKRYEQGVPSDQAVMSGLHVLK